MSRNDERFGAQDSNFGQSAAPAVAVGSGPESKSEVFNWTTPTEIVDLPSAGVFYPEGHPLHGQSSVEIKFMTAKEEDILTSKALLRKGVAIDRMLESLFVDQRIKTKDLLVGDKNAITVAARITGYGPEYETRVTCPACQAKLQHTFDLSEIEIINTEQEFLEYGIEGTQNGTFSVTLPLTKAVVECRLLTGADETALLKIAERKQKSKLSDSVLLESFKSFMVSVNGETDIGFLSTFIMNMPARDSRFLRKAFAAMTPNVDMTQEIVCGECGTDSVLEIPLTADFFWPK